VSRALILLAAIFALGPEAVSLDQQLASRQPMGWNSWNKFGCDVSEDLTALTSLGSRIGVEAELQAFCMDVVGKRLHARRKMETSALHGKIWGIPPA